MSANILSWYSCHLTQYTEFWDLQVADGALEMGLGIVAPCPDAAHEGHSVSCGGDRTLPALSTAPARFPPCWLNFFNFLVFLLCCDRSFQPAGLLPLYYPFSSLQHSTF